MFRFGVLRLLGPSVSLPKGPPAASRPCRASGLEASRTFQGPPGASNQFQGVQKSVFSCFAGWLLLNGFGCQEQSFLPPLSVDGGGSLNPADDSFCGFPAGLPFVLLFFSNASSQ